MRCSECLQVQAKFDDELDALSSVELERHWEHCPECRELRQSLERTRDRLRRELPHYRTPAVLRARIHQALVIEEESGGARPPAASHPVWRMPSFWWGGLTGVGAAMTAGVIGFLVLALPIANPVVDALLDDHVRSLGSGHLIDVVSTDKHAVKPWFAGRADTSPAVADFASQGYTLAGGRVDPLDHQRAAVTVYRHGAHVINVFCWIAPLGPLPGNTTRHGYHLAFWRSGDLAYAAVSDTAWDELLGLEHLLRGLGTSDVPPDNSSPTTE